MSPPCGIWATCSRIENPDRNSSDYRSQPHFVSKPLGSYELDQAELGSLAGGMDSRASLYLRWSNPPCFGVIERTP